MEAKNTKIYDNTLLIIMHIFNLASDIFFQHQIFPTLHPFIHPLPTHPHTLIHPPAVIQPQTRSIIRTTQ